MEEYKKQQYKEEEKEHIIEVLWKVTPCKVVSIFTSSFQTVCISMDTSDSLQSHKKEKRC